MRQHRHSERIQHRIRIFMFPLGQKRRTRQKSQRPHREMGKRQIKKRQLPKQHQNPKQNKAPCASTGL